MFNHKEPKAPEFSYGPNNRTQEVLLKEEKKLKNISPLSFSSQVDYYYKWSVKWTTLCLNVFHFRFSQKTSLLAGGFSWIISAVILLTPVFINRWKEFGYNESSGF